MNRNSRIYHPKVQTHCSRCHGRGTHPRLESIWEQPAGPLVKCRLCDGTGRRDITKEPRP